MKVTKEGDPQSAIPSGFPACARLVRRLRNSHYVLRQSPPTTPDQPPLLGGGTGEIKAKIKFKSGFKNKNELHVWALCAHTVFAVDLLTPVHRLEKSQTRGGLGEDCLST